MKKHAALITLGLLLALPFVFAPQIMAEYEIDRRVEGLMDRGEYVPGELLVKYKEDISASEKLSTTEIEPEGVVQLAPVKAGKELEVETIKVNPAKFRDTLESLVRDPRVEKVQPNYVYELTEWDVNTTTATPGDFDAANHWYYNYSDLRQAWKKLSCPEGPNCGGNESIIVAVIDTGLAAFNFDDTEGLSGGNFIANPEYENINLYTNPDEIPDNNLDDDCNGVVDDVHGIDSYAVLVSGTNTCLGEVPQTVTSDYYKAGKPTDNFGHGTYVTGLIASAVDNEADTSISPSFNTQIMPISANFHYTNSFATSSIITAISYATEYEVDVINMSLGGPYYDEFLDDAVQEAWNAGVVVVASSGNTGVEELTYPSSLDNVVAVGAVNSSGSRSGYSTYGEQVDVVAYVGSGASPGNATWQSTLACFSSCDVEEMGDGFVNRYGIGTSYAAPQVAALAAMIKSYDPALTNSEIVQLIKDSATDLGAAGRDNETGYGVINFNDALQAVDLYNESIPMAIQVYRLFNFERGVHFYSASVTETNKVADYEVFNYEGPAFKVLPKEAEVEGSTTVYRLFNNQRGVHFYTASESEKDKVANYEAYDLEGPAYKVFTDPAEGLKPVYRFFVLDRGVHFYTVSESERAKVSELETFAYEGIAYYVYE